MSARWIGVALGSVTVSCAAWWLHLAAVRPAEAPQLDDPRGEPSPALRYVCRDLCEQHDMTPTIVWMEDRQGWTCMCDPSVGC